jgi:hypothetical protein
LIWRETSGSKNFGFPAGVELHG